MLLVFLVSTLDIKLKSPVRNALFTTYPSLMRDLLIPR